MASLKRSIFLTFVILLFQSMPIYAFSEFYFYNCCKKAHVFSVIAVPSLPYGMVKRVPSDHDHTFKIKHGDYCAETGSIRYNFNGARNIIHVQPGDYIRTVSKKTHGRHTYCHAELSTKEDYDKPC